MNVNAKNPPSNSSDNDDFEFDDTFQPESKNPPTLLLKTIMAFLLHLQHFFHVDIKQITYRRNQGNEIFHQTTRRGLQKRG